MTGRGPLVLAVLLSLGATSCDCMREVTAVIIDAGTGAPIADAEVRERHASGSYDNEVFRTSTDGAFTFSDVPGGLFRCPDVQLHVARPGYVPVDRTFPSFATGDTIRLQHER